MANFSIAGNTGGASGAGAQVQLVSDRGDIVQTVISDNNGIYSFATVSDARTYFLTATLAGSVYRVRKVVTLNGANVSDVNFQLFAANASNVNNPGF